MGRGSSTRDRLDMDNEMLQALVDLLDLIGESGREPRALQEGLLRRLIQLSGAERGVILRRRSGPAGGEEADQVEKAAGPEDHLITELALDARGEPIPEVYRISRSLPLEAAQTRSGICRIRGFDGYAEMESTSSMEAYSLRSVMCLPLMTGQAVLGVLYLDSEARIRAFEERDLQRLQVLCNHLALHLENARFWAERRRLEEQRRQALEIELDRLRRQLEDQEILVGESPVMRRLLDQVRKVADTDATVLILGETGTGKESLAQLIHRSSRRRDQAFMIIDSGTIPENLLESELFGHEKGAFTGADARRLGKFELAHRGTVFLDEIGDLPLKLQGKLLRVLEQRRIQRVGGSRSIETDIRVLAATNRNLEQMVQEGRFRSDLFFRLNVVRIELPPLRERDQDRLLLARHFLRIFADRYGKSELELSPASLTALEAHGWPGNIREMKHRIQRAVILAEDPQVRPSDLDLVDGASEDGIGESSDPTVTERLKEMVRAAAEGRADRPVWPTLIEPLEAWLVKEALLRAGGNRTRASALLGIERRKLTRRAERLSTGPDRGDPPEELLPALQELLDRRASRGDGDHSDLLRALQDAALRAAFTAVGPERGPVRDLLGLPASTLRRRLERLDL